MTDNGPQSSKKTIPRRRQSNQWHFTKIIDTGTIINLNLATHHTNIQYMSYTILKSKNKKKNDYVFGYIRLTNRLSPPGLEKLIGNAEFIKATVGNDYLLKILMQPTYWETGNIEKSSLAKFRVSIAKLKKAIHHATNVNEMQPKLRHIYLKDPILVQSYIDLAKATKETNATNATRTTTPKVTKEVTGKTTCVVMQPHHWKPDDLTLTPPPVQQPSRLVQEVKDVPDCSESGYNSDHSNSDSDDSNTELHEIIEILPMRVYEDASYKPTKKEVEYVQMGFVVPNAKLAPEFEIWRASQPRLNPENFTPVNHSP